MSRENPFLSCIVPAFNESENLQKFIPALAKTLEAENIQFEILVVDDGSKDNSIATLSSMLDKYPLRILELSRNFGKEAALSAGIDHVSDRHLAQIGRAHV